MRDGNVERRRAKERDPTIVVFDQYAFDLTRLPPAPQMVIGLREKYLWELAVSRRADDNALKSSPGQFRVELHERLIAPLYPLAFGVIAFAVLGFPRTTRQSRERVAHRRHRRRRGVAARRLRGHGDGGQFPAGADRTVMPPSPRTMGFGAFLIWRGQPLEIDEKVAIGAKALGGLLRAEQFAVGQRLLLPFTGLPAPVQRLDGLDRSMTCQFGARRPAAWTTWPRSARAVEHGRGGASLHASVPDVRTPEPPSVCRPEGRGGADPPAAASSTAGPIGGAIVCRSLSWRSARPAPPLPAFLFGRGINEAYVDRSFDGVAVVAVAMIVMFAIKGMASYGQAVTLARIGNHIIADNQTQHVRQAAGAEHRLLCRPPFLRIRRADHVRRGVGGAGAQPPDQCARARSVCR